MMQVIAPVFWAITGKCGTLRKQDLVTAKTWSVRCCYFMFDALAAGTQYLVQARAITRGGTTNWSDSVAMYAN